MKFKEILNKIGYWKKCDRIGPDIPWTHWRLYFKSTMLKLCKNKFKKFDSTSEFRPGAYAICCSKISIGKYVTIRPGTMLFVDTRPEETAEIIIEDKVLMGSGIHIYTSNHQYNNPEIPIYDQGHKDSKSVILRKGCWIGANSILLPGVEIGENSVVAAGSTVTRSVPPKVVVAGNPAKIIKEIN